MRNLKTIEKKVRAVLEKNEDARNDDRFFEICFKKTSYDSKKNLMHRTHLSFDSSVVSETAPSSRSVTT